MLLSGLRSAEVLGLRVADIDIGQGWVRVTGKGDKERRVPLDPDVAGLIQSYLLAERPETASKSLFVVAKGPHRGQPLTAAGLRRVFRYHREISGVAAGHPHALRHTFGTALAEAGVDLAVLQALMGHDHVESSAAYIHLAPAHVRAAYDAARRAAAGRGRRSPLMPPAKTPVPAQAAAIYDAYRDCLAARGVGNKTFDSGARCFLARFPDPQAWADLPLEQRLAGTRPHLQPLLNFLMLHRHLRPGYDYLLDRKLTAILREAAASPLGGRPGPVPGRRRGAGLLRAGPYRDGVPDRGPHADPDRTRPRGAGRRPTSTRSGRRSPSGKNAWAASSSTTTVPFTPPAPWSTTSALRPSRYPSGARWAGGAGNATWTG